MVSPLDDHGQVNRKALRVLTKYLLDNGVHGLFPVGTQGEFFALEREEKKQVWETVVEETQRRVPVYAGTGAITTREAIRLTKMAEGAGVDAVSVITPYFINPSQSELYEHYRSIASSTNLPVILYSNPGRTGVKLAVETAVKLSKIDNIAGIKDSSGDMTLTQEYIRRTSDDFAVLAGRDTLIYATLACGGKGSIAATANVAPGVVVEIYQNFIQGNCEKALEAQYRLAPLRMAFGLGTFPVVIKEALAMIGIEVGPTRSPVGLMTEENRKELRQVLTDLGVL
jgi:4-hydroxy-tetrahydrodipicolinate synthase